MKRLIALLCALMMLTGCSVGGGGRESASPSSLTDRPIAVVEGSSSAGNLEINDLWGIALSAKDVTTTGLTLVCTQSGGGDVTELLTGQYFVLEQSRADRWDTCEITLENYAFTQEGWIIPLNDSVEWDVDWEWLYGQMSAGKYRIGKEIMNFRGPGDYDQEMFYAEFTVE